MVDRWTGPRLLSLRGPKKKAVVGIRPREARGEVSGGKTGDDGGSTSGGVGMVMSGGRTGDGGGLTSRGVGVDGREEYSSSEV